MTKETLNTPKSNEDKSLRYASVEEISERIHEGYERAAMTIGLVSEALRQKTGGLLSMELSERGFPVPVFGKDLSTEERSEKQAKFDEIFDKFPNEVKDFVMGRQQDESGNRFSPDFQHTVPSLESVLGAPGNTSGEKLDKLAENFAYGSMDQDPDNVRVVKHGNMYDGYWYEAQMDGASEGTPAERDTPNWMQFTEGDAAALYAEDILHNAQLAGLVEPQPTPERHAA